MKSLPRNGRPRAVALSKRANIFCLERCRVMQKDEKVVYLTDTGQQVEKMFNIPDKNTLFLLLGTGTSITNAAMRKLSESNVVVGFCGSGGAPLSALEDITFVLPQDEYRPTEYAQRWYGLWVHEDSRLKLAKSLIQTRLEWTADGWRNAGLVIPDNLIQEIQARSLNAQSTMEVLTVEAHWAKHLYAFLAQQHNLSFRREEGKRASESDADLVNSLIDHGNYLAYGYAAVVLHGLGIPFWLPVLHGKTRRGGLVFDVADLIKDCLVLPAAFDLGCSGIPARDADKQLRARIIELVDEQRLVSKVFDEMKRQTTL